MISEHVSGVLEHKRQVAALLQIVASDLIRRAIVHDDSKFSPEELEGFERMTPILKTLEYGTQDYKDALKELGPSLQHHYQHNDHHPEFSEDGINAMNLNQLIEMVCDWIAATQRVKNGNIYESLPKNKERFGIDEQLAHIIYNTVVTLHGPEHPDPNTLYPDMLF